MTKHKIIVTRRWPQTVERALGEHFDVTLNEADEPMDQAALKDAFQSYDGVCPTVTDKIGADLFDGAKAKIVSNYGVGYNHIDVAAANAAGLTVTNTPEVLTDATADLAITLLLMISRRTGEAERQVRANGWTGWRPTHMRGTQVTGKTIGIIGMGRIGQAMARRCHFGFGMNVIFYDAFPVKGLDFPAKQLETIDEVLEKSDFVSLHCPGGGDNIGLIDAARLGRMKDGAYIVNTARGDIIKQDDLIAALRNGTIRGAGLDVFDGEPKVPDDLKTMENVVLLPHLGSATEETREAMGLRVLENLKTFFDGGTPRDAVKA